MAGDMKIRELFPQVNEVIYLDAASLAPLSRPVEEAVKSYLEEWRTHGSYGFEGWSKKLEGARRLTANLVGAKAEEVAFLTSTSQGVNLAAMLSNLSKGDTVIVSSGDFPANVLPFKNLEKKGVKVKFISPHPDAGELEAALNDNVKLVSLSHVNYSSGYRIDIEEIGRLCSSAGVLFHLDAIQSLGVFEVDVYKARVDFLSAGGYKWLLGPLGTAIFFCREEHLGETPMLGWRSIENFQNLKIENYRVLREAKKFELGNPDFGALMGLKAALELIERIGRRRIERKVMELAFYLRELLEEANFKLLSSFKRGNSSGIVSFEAPGVTKEMLKERGIVATVRDNVRFSPHLYNTGEDIEEAVKILSKLP